MVMIRVVLTNAFATAVQGKYLGFPLYIKKKKKKKKKNAETAVWPIPFLINMFSALMGSQFCLYLLTSCRRRAELIAGICWIKSQSPLFPRGRGGGAWLQTIS